MARAKVRGGLGAAIKLQTYEAEVVHDLCQLGCQAELIGQVGRAIEALLGGRILAAEVMHGSEICVRLYHEAVVAGLRRELLLSAVEDDCLVVTTHSCAAGTDKPQGLAEVGIAFDCLFAQLHRGLVVPAEELAACGKETLLGS